MKMKTNIFSCYTIGYLRLLATILSVPILISSTSVSKNNDSEVYDIANIYEKVELDSGSKALDSFGNIKEVKAVFVPTKLDTKRYNVKVTRIDSNFYQICGTDIYIETKYCYEYATRDDAILNITSNYGYSKGEIIFLE